MTHFVTTDQMHAAAGFVSRGWGEYGYRLGIESSFSGGAVFLVRCSDGGEFRILVDRWGNASQPAQCNKGTIGCEDENLCHDLCDAV